MDMRRLIVLAALALVACGSAGASRLEAPSVSPSYVVLRTQSGPSMGTDAQRVREGLPRAAALPEVHSACALRRGASC